MKWLQNGNLAKLVAFFVISVVITCTVSFAANGWESFVNSGAASDDVLTGDNSQNQTDNEEDVTVPNEEEVPAVLPTPKYYHSITGLEVSLDESLKRPISFVFSSTDPLYGISSSYLTIEIPTEYGNTRLLCFTDDGKTLGKIGSLAPTRGYISNLASYFGGILLSYGNDDSIEYDHYSPTDTLDFSATPGYCYTEYSSFVYTNGDLVNAFMNNGKISGTLAESPDLPYLFTEDGSRVTLDGELASNVSVVYSDTNTTLLSYSQTERCYMLSKNGSFKTDLINDKPIRYDNVFILYADSTTYESEEATQLILNTASRGKGIYMTDGVYTEILWERDTSGSLIFYDLNGEQIFANRGTTYISYVKSSMKNSVKIS